MSAIMRQRPPSKKDGKRPLPAALAVSPTDFEDLYYGPQRWRIHFLRRLKRRFERRWKRELQKRTERKTSKPDHALYIRAFLLVGDNDFKLGELPELPRMMPANGRSFAYYMLTVGGEELAAFFDPVEAIKWRQAVETYLDEERETSPTIVEHTHYRHTNAFEKCG